MIERSVAVGICLNCRVMRSTSCLPYLDYKLIAIFRYRSYASVPFGTLRNCSVAETDNVACVVLICAVVVAFHLCKVWWRAARVSCGTTSVKSSKYRANRQISRTLRWANSRDKKSTAYVNVKCLLHNKLYQETCSFYATIRKDLRVSHCRCCVFVTATAMRWRSLASPLAFVEIKQVHL